MRTSNTGQSHDPRIPALDGLRGIAILMVVFWHYWASRAELKPGFVSHYIMPVLGIGWSGVDLFFVLSGFLIGGILFDNQNAQNYFKVFYARRVCRIIPLFYLVLVLFAFAEVCLPILVAKTPDLFKNHVPLWSYFAFVQNFTMVHAHNFGPGWLGVTWSLAVEEQFYLLLPLIIRYTPPAKVPYVLGCLILLAPVLRIAISAFFPDTFVPPLVIMPCRADGLMLGVACAYAMRQPACNDYLQKNLKFLYVCSIVLGIAVYCVSFPSYQPGVPLMMICGYTLLDLLYASLLLIATNERQGVVSSVTRNATLRWCGLIAYGLYLFHEPVNGVLHGLIFKARPEVTTPQKLLVTLLAFTISYALASMSWIWFEKGIIRFGHRLKYQVDPDNVVIRSRPGLLEAAKN